MEDLINDSIIESISEEYQIYKMTCETIPTKYVIRDEDGELVRHNNMTFFPSLKDADKALACLLYTSPSPRDVEESRMPSSA